MNIWLGLGALCSLLAALAHLACLPGGAPAFRLLGAGEALAGMAEKGHWYPPVAALAIGGVLMLWAVYALAGAGAMAPLPAMRLVLAGITGIYLLRAVAFPWLKPFFPDNSPAFWLVSSGICLVIGLLHLAGLAQVWHRLA